MRDRKALIDLIYAPWAGNGSDLAADIGELPVTVNQWRYRGSIPPKYWQKIIDKAEAREGEIGLDLFVELAALPPEPTANAA